MYIVDANTLLHEIENELPDLSKTLEAATQQKYRRIDRIAQLCLLGSQPLCQYIGTALPARSALLLANGAGAASTTIAMMNSILVHRDPPKPFNFVNSLGNSACFFLAKMFGINGPSATVAQENFSFESALLQAELSLESSDACLVGAVDEVTLPLHEHLARQQLTQNYLTSFEGSHWLLLHQQASATATVKIERPHYTSSLIELQQEVQRLKPERLYLNFQDSEKNFLFSKLECIEPATGIFPHRGFSAHNFVLAAKALREGQCKRCCVLTRNHITSEAASEYCLTYLTNI